MKRLNKKGFTLVELLAVIVILALLMVVATRSIGSIMDSSKKSAMETELKKILSSYNTYKEQKIIDPNADIKIITKDAAIDSNGVISGSDGGYHFTINTASGNFCITDTNKGSEGSFVDTDITYNTNGSNETLNYHASIKACP